MFLERIGAGENAIWFMNQPIISEYLKLVDSVGGKGLFSKTNINAALAMFPARTDDVVAARIDVAKLKDNISAYSFGELGAERNAEQQKILVEFLKYAKMAQYSFKLTQATNYDTTKFRNSDSFSRKATKTDIANQTNIFSSASKILESSFIKDQRDFIDSAMSAMGEVLKLEKDDLRIITSDVLRPYSELEYMSQDDFDRIASKIKASFLDYIVQTKTGINLEIKDLIVNAGTSVAAQLVEAQKNFPNVKILNDLTVVSSDRIEGGAKTIKLKANVKDAYDENMYTEMMRELRDNPDTRDLFYDIVTLSILQGSYQSAVSIKNIIPVEDFSEIIKPIIDNLEATPDVQMFSKGMFQRNNWKDEAAVPSISPYFKASEEPIGVIAVGDEMEDIYKYSSPLFPNLPAFSIKDTDRKVLLLSETYNATEVQYDFVKVPRVVTTRTGDLVDMATGKTILKAQKVKRIASGDTALNDFYGYQKVKYKNGDPVVTDRGQHVYKLVNLYGDGALVSEYYNDGRPSVIDNNTVKIDNEIPDADLIRFFAPRIETKAVPSQEMVETAPAQSKVVANIPQKKVSGVESYGSLVTAAPNVIEALGPNPHSIDMIEAGFRTRTTRSSDEMDRYAVNVGDIVSHFGESADGTTKRILARVTAIHRKGTPGFKGTWAKEGWRAQDVDVIDRFKPGAAAIEFEVIKETPEPGKIAPEGLPPIDDNNQNSCG
jgi:hypothetical protein